MINHDLSYKYARLRERGYKSVIHLRDLDYQAVEYASELSSGAGMAAMQNLLKQTRRMRYLPFPIRWRRGAARHSAGRAAGARRYRGGRL